MVPIERPAGLPLAFGSKIQSGAVLAQVDSVPDTVLAISTVVDTNNDGVLDLDRDITMPCERRPDHWWCERPTQRAILRTVNGAVHEIVMTPGPYVVAACEGATCIPVDVLQEGSLRIVRECARPFNALALVGDVTDERIELRGVLVTQDPTWHLVPKRSDRRNEQIATSVPPRVGAAADVWIGPRVLANPEQLDPLPPTSAQLEAAAKSGATAVVARVDAVLFNNCASLPDCEMWLGIATRTTVARSPRLRVEALADTFMPMIHSESTQ
ncbi:MAG: hypothetical protein IPL61_29510 [Myxococcales bacterium]|nr:hypothetical protein [Myxococcales bacterium]